MSLTCHVCGCSVDESNPAFIGMLVNRAVSLGARIVETRAQIIVLRNKVGGKQVGKKTPGHILDQRERDLTQLAALEEALPRFEGTLAGMGFRIRELDQVRNEERKRGQSHQHQR